MSTTTLEIRLLGPLDVLRNGEAQPLPRSRKSRALLGYLVTTSRPLLRERLCDLLWDGPGDPRAELRWSLTKIRPLLDRDAQRVVTDHERVWFEPKGASVDLHAVREALGGRPSVASIDTLRSAAAHFRGAFLEGLQLPDAYEFASWLAAEREASRSLQVLTLSTLTERLRDTPNEAIPFARERLAIDPLAEDAHAALITLLGALGRVRDAHEQYDNCCRILKQELCRGPSDVLERARRSLGSRSAIATRAPSPPAGHSVVSPPSRLIGRAAECTLLDRLVSARGANRACDVLLVTGEPGIGKTRLLEELGERVRAANGVVLAGRAFEAEMVRPYGSWIDALDSSAVASLPEAIRAELAPLLPEATGETREPSDRNRLFERVARLLHELAREHTPLVVLLDDLHWFDSGSAALLHFVARASAGDRIILACSARQPALDANTGAAAFVRAMRRDGRLREIVLGPLQRDEIIALAASVDPRADSARVASLSDGNPLFAMELARAPARAGAVPATLDALIGDHLAQLSERARDLVAWAAALGRSFDAEILGRVAAIAPAELLPAVEEMERSAVVRTVSGGAAYDFTHDVVRRVAYARLSGPRARIVHLQIARTLESVADATHSVAGDVAHHAALGGDAALAARAAVRAGERCLRLFANAEARALAERGLVSAAELPAPDRLILEIELMRVYVHAGGARGSEAEILSRLERVIQEAQTLSLHAQAQIGFYLISYVHYHGEDWDEAREDTLRAVEAGQAGDTETATRAMANSGRCLASIDREIPRARELLTSARERALRLGIELTDIPWGLGIIGQYEGDLDTAVKELTRAVALARGRQEHWPATDCLVRLAQVALEHGRYEALLRHCAEAAPIAARLGEGSDGPLASGLAALAGLASGEREAVPRLEAALSALRELDSKIALAYLLTSASELDLSIGDTGRARERANEALSAAKAVTHRSGIVLACAVLSRVALATGDDTLARQYAATACEESSEPYAVNARAASRAREAMAMLKMRIPTLAPTPEPTTRT